MYARTRLITIARPLLAMLVLLSLLSMAAPKPTHAAGGAKSYEELANHFVQYGATAKAYFTLVITQEDGRTAYGTHGLIHSYNQSNQTFSGDITPLFSDRTSGTNQQPFSLARVDDSSSVTIQRTGTNSYKAIITSKNYGYQTVVNQSRTSYSKMLIGWSDTIGWGSGKALYAISFNEAFLLG